MTPESSALNNSRLTQPELASIFGAADQYIAGRFATWRQWRRHLHMHPERAWSEVNTTRFLAERLADVDLALRPGPRGFGGFVDIQNKNAAEQTDSKFFAVRGDIDAIPVLEANEVDYRSKIDGLMHACGHDVHGTTVLAVCETLQHLSKDLGIELPFNFRAIFQPAEEVAEGARESIEAGALENVAAILAMHVDPNYGYGTVGLRNGVQTARCDEIKVTCTGIGGHGARPHETNDPILAATQFINAAYALVPRIYDARQELVLSFCEIKGGNSANVIPVDVSMRGTMRSFNDATCEATFARLAKLAENLGAAFQVKIDLQRGVSVPSVNNNEAMNELVRKAASSCSDVESLVTVDKSLGGEDVSFFQQHVPGSLIRMGSAIKGRPSAHLHSPNFDVDEQVIPLACKLFVRSVLQWFADPSS